MRSPLTQLVRPVVLTASLFAAATSYIGAQTLFDFARSEGPQLNLLAVATSPEHYAAEAATNSPFAIYSSSDTADADAELPDAPSSIFQHKKNKQAPATKDGLPDPASRASKRPGNPEIGQYTKYIPAGYVTHRQTLREKEITGANDLYSFGNVGGWFISAGWSHLTNSSPNYGTDRGAFGQRLGAAALRSTSQGVFTDMIFSPLFHQDLRYYVKGPQYNVIRRSLYATSRVFIARRDTSSTTINTALLSGYLATAAMTQLYYPEENRGFGNVMGSYGSSLGGAVLSNIFNEFQSDILMFVHLKKKTYEPFSPVK